jgi:hypothetical protein
MTEPEQVPPAGANLNHLVLALVEILEDERLPQLSAFFDDRIPATAWPISAVEDIPMVRTVVGELSRCLAIFFSHLDHLGVDPQAHPVLVVPFYSTGGECWSQPAPFGEDACHLVFIDLRVIYEAFAIALASPLFSEASQLHLAQAILGSTLAARLCGAAQPSLKRITLGLLATVQHAPDDEDGVPTPIFRLSDMLKASACDEDQAAFVLKAIARRVLFHELGHVLFELYPDASLLYNNLIESWLQFHIDDPEHHREHDKAGLMFLRKIGVPEAGNFGSEQLKQELNVAVNLHFGDLSKGDLEEISCDLFSTELTVAAAETPPITPHQAYSLRSAIEVFDTVNGDLRNARGSFQIIAEAVRDTERQLAGEIPRNDEAVAEFSKRRSANRQRVAALSAVRLYMTQKVAEISLAKMLAVNDDLEFALSLFDQIGEEQAKLHGFMVRLRYLFEQRICCDVAAYKISSIGRGIEVLLGDKATATPLDSAGDPFALYLFGWTTSRAHTATS